MTNSPLLVERRGHVAVLTFNRPDRLNAMDPTMRAALEQAWGELGADPEVRAIVTTGAGDRAFCSGADVGGLEQTMSDAATATTQPFPRFTARWSHVYKPVICAVNGVCAGAGLHFVACSDIVIASENATFLDPHVDVGQVTALEPIDLSRRIPLEAVLRMVVLGRSERISAQRAYQLGMVSEVLRLADLRDRALELAEIAASKSPAAMQASLRSVWEGLDRGLSDAQQHGWDLLLAHRAHPDASEGPKAFREKRAPVWAAPTLAKPDPMP
jgi:enoyl-CoA hydratase/carnithine racemase